MLTPGVRLEWLVGAAGAGLAVLALNIAAQSIAPRWRDRRFRFGIVLLLADALVQWLYFFGGAWSIDRDFVVVVSSELAEKRAGEVSDALQFMPPGTQVKIVRIAAEGAAERKTPAIDWRDVRTWTASAAAATLQADLEKTAIVEYKQELRPQTILDACVGKAWRWLPFWPRRGAILFFHDASNNWSALQRATETYWAPGPLLNTLRTRSTEAFYLESRSSLESGRLDVRLEHGTLGLEGLPAESDDDSVPATKLSEMGDWLFVTLVGCPDVPQNGTCGVKASIDGPLPSATTPPRSDLPFLECTNVEMKDHQIKLVLNELCQSSTSTAFRNPNVVRSGNSDWGPRPGWHRLEVEIDAPSSSPARRFFTKVHYFLVESHRVVVFEHRGVLGELRAPNGASWAHRPPPRRFPTCCFSTSAAPPRRVRPPMCIAGHRRTFMVRRIAPPVRCAFTSSGARILKRGAGAPSRATRSVNSCAGPVAWSLSSQRPPTCGRSTRQSPADSKRPLPAG